MALKISKVTIEQLLTSTDPLVRSFSKWLVKESILIPAIQQWKDGEPFLCLDFLINEDFLIRFHEYGIVKLFYRKRQIREGRAADGNALEILQTWVEFIKNKREELLQGPTLT